MPPVREQTAYFGLYSHYTHSIPFCLHYFYEITEKIFLLREDDIMAVYLLYFLCVIHNMYKNFFLIRIDLIRIVW